MVTAFKFHFFFLIFKNRLEFTGKTRDPTVSIFLLYFFFFNKNGIVFIPSWVGALEQIEQMVEAGAVNKNTEQCHLRMKMQ